VITILAFFGIGLNVEKDMFRTDEFMFMKTLSLLRISYISFGSIEEAELLSCTSTIFPEDVEREAHVLGIEEP